MSAADTFPPDDHGSSLPPDDHGSPSSHGPIEGRTPPQAMDAEMSVLGAMLISADAILDVQGVLSGADFYRPTHETIYDAIVAMSNRGEPVDMVTVASELTKRNELDRVGGAIYLHTLASSVPIAANAEFYAKQVAEAAILRRIINAGTRIVQTGYAQEGTAEDIADRARSLVDEVTAGMNPDTGMTFEQIMEQVIDIAEHGEAATLSTPWSDLDRVLVGLAPGRLTVVAARPGVGKSLWLSNTARHFAQNHKKGVLFSSLEMPAKEVGQRLLADLASVNLTRLAAGGGAVEEREWAQIMRHYSNMQSWPMRIDDHPHQTIGHIRRAAREMQRKADRGQGPELGVVLVDYLQLVTPTKSGQNTNRAEEVGEISRGLKLLARELNIPVVAAAQLNRAGATAPTLTDLRESGSIEADADQVILLHRESMDLPEIDAIVAKNRSGGLGVATLLQMGHYARLAEPYRGPGAVA